MQFTLQGARLVDAMLDLPDSAISVHDHSIEYIGPAHQDLPNCIDATDMIVTPGFIEVHTHGGGGFNLHTLDVEEIHSYARWVVSTGVTSFLIAVVGTPQTLPEPQLLTAVAAIEQGKALGFANMAESVGIFLEGPYINEKRRGAHLPVWLRTPSQAETRHILDITRGYLRLVTLAPELPHAGEMLQDLCAAGVTVSIGHTDADYEQTLAAIDQGVTHVTHCFNAMRGLHHREPGPIAAVVQADQVRGELIADGIHVHPAMMNVLVKLLGPARTVVVTDAQSCAGRPDGPFEFAGQAANVINGAAFLADGTLAGSVLTMDVALRNILRSTHVTLGEAVRMLTWNPALSAGVADRKGRLQAGYAADLLIFDRDLQLQATISQGQVVYATAAWQERLQVH